MSILIGHMSAKEAVFAVDTLASSPVVTMTEPMHVSKAFPVPHIGAVVGTRGAGGFQSWLMTAINNVVLNDFDALKAQLPDLASAAYTRAAPQMRDYGLPMIVEALAVGWSKAQGRASGIFVKNYPGEAPPEKEDAYGYAGDFGAADVPDGIFAVPGPATEDVRDIQARWKRMDMRERMIAVARGSRANAENNYSAFGAIGGRLIMFNVGKHAVECRTIYEWPDEAAKPAEAANVVRLGVSRVAA